MYGQEVQAKVTRMKKPSVLTLSQPMQSSWENYSKVFTLNEKAVLPEFPIVVPDIFG